MGRKAKFTEAVWNEILHRAMTEPVCALAREYGVAESSIRARVNKSAENAGINSERIKTIANQVADVREVVHSLTPLAQRQVMSMADEIERIRHPLSRAAAMNAQTASVLAGIAQKQINKVNQADPMDEPDILQGAAALLKLSNEASTLPTNMLRLYADAAKQDEDKSNTPTHYQVTREVVDAKAR